MAGGNRGAAPPLLPAAPELQPQDLLALPRPSRGPGPPRSPRPGLAVHAAPGGMAAGGRRRRPLRYQSLAALVEDSQWPFLFLVSDFSYGADDYDGEGNEEQKGPPEGSETMPYIDESPTMSPQLSARGQGGGDSISPTPPEGLAPGVGAPAFPSGGGGGGKAGMGVVDQALPGTLLGEQGWGNVDLAPLPPHPSPGPLRLGSPPPPAALSATPAPISASSTSHLLPLPSGHPHSLPLSAFSSNPSLAGWGLGEGTGPSLWARAAHMACGL